MHRVRSFLQVEAREPAADPLLLDHLSHLSGCLRRLDQAKREIVAVVALQRCAVQGLNPRDAMLVIACTQAAGDWPLLRSGHAVAPLYSAAIAAWVGRPGRRSLYA
jgi:hypothetical protein